jgi:hypothetical protein
MSSIAPTTVTCAKTVPEAKTLTGALALFLRFPTPKILGAKALLFVVLRSLLGEFSIWESAVVAAVILWWPFQEWFLHKTVLHLKPRVIFGHNFDPMFAKRHRYHHSFPWILETTFLPTGFVLAMTPLHVGLWFLFAPNWEFACTGIAAYTFVTIVYEWTHYLTHSPYRPRSEYVKKIYKNHALHHFKNENYWFSFTVPAIDRFCGTDPEGNVVKSDTCKTLGVDDGFVAP